MIVVDTSAVVALFLSEPDADLLRDVMRAADDARMSAANAAECQIVLDNRTGDDNGELLRAMLFELGWNATQVYDALRDEGYTVGRQSINRHRGRKCRCFKAAA